MRYDVNIFYPIIKKSNKYNLNISIYYSIRNIQVLLNWVVFKYFSNNRNVTRTATRDRNVTGCQRALNRYLCVFDIKIVRQ